MDLDQLLESVVESFALEAHRKGLALHFAQSPETPAYVMADRVRLVQVLSNLIANAVKYTDAGSVTVSADVAPSLVRISVSDTGPGIPESELERVFEPFTQVDGGPTRAYNGAGIGLAVARELVDLMGGRILLDSVVGEGTVLTIELPLASAGRRRETAGMLREAPTVVLVGPPTPSRRSLEAWGREVGATVKTADGPGAIDGICDFQPDLVLVLDEGGGDGLLRTLGEKCPGADLRVARRIGAPGERGGHLTQPVMPTTFLRLLAGDGETGTGPEAEAHAPETTETDAADMGVSGLLQRFPPSDLSEDRLLELAAAAGEVRTNSGGGSSRVDEVLFRVSLAARRGDLDTVRERLSELGQMRLNQYNGER